MKTRLVSVLLLLFAVIGVVSAQESPRPRRPNEITDGSKEAQSNRQSEPPTMALSVDTANANTGPPATAIAAHDEKETQDQPVTVRGMPVIDVSRDWIDYTQWIVTLILLVFGIYNVILVERTLVATKIAAIAAKTSADAQILAERAYLDFAHTRAGFRKQDNGDYLVVMNIKNCGNTPCAVDRGWVRVFADLAEQGHLFWPMMPDQEIPGGFLVAGKHYETGVTIKLTQEQLVQLHSGRLYLVAWVNYVDAFNQQHRVGYARFLWVLPNGTIMLAWNRESPRYNYDMPIDKHGQPHQQQGQPEKRTEL